MGGSIARNFEKAGVSIMAWDVAPETRTAIQEEAGIAIAPPGEMAATCNAIFFVVPATPERRALRVRTVSWREQPGG
jgi:3-hydroxyisobutyrate dehydrogenase-like beta-hydroxyacid dehydrogenase